MPDQRVQPTAGRLVTIEVDGEVADARAGESIAAALLARGRHGPRRAWRKVFCNTGVCGDCSVFVLGPEGERSSRRACLTPVADGMRVLTRGDRASG